MIETQGLKTVYDGPTERGTTDGAIDIVAVHGLGANPDHAWIYRSKSPSSSGSWFSGSSLAGAPNTGGEVHEAEVQPPVNWLKDFLPEKIPQARIMCYEYNSKWLGIDLPKQSLSGIATGLLESLYQKDSGDKRPTIFIGHSYGGVVIEQAFVQADSASSSYQRLMQKTAGIIFLGVPFRGSAAQRIGNMIASYAKIFGLAENSLMRNLGLNSEVLEDLLHQFAKIVSNRRDQVICFYELRPTSYLRNAPTRFRPYGQANVTEMVVERWSATIDGFPRFQLDKDHSGISRFSSREDESYVLVSSKISELASTSSLVHGKKPQGYVQDDSRINLLLKKLRDGLDGRLGPGIGEAVLDERRNEVKLIEECLQGLFLSNPLDDRQGIINMKGEGVTGTCTWILSNESYQAWSEDSESKLLWLSGGPGKGKTIISVFLTKELARLVEDCQHTTLVYFFCDNKNKKQNSALAILRSLILQLLRQRPDLFQYILPEFRFARETIMCNRDALWRIFENMVLSLKQCKTYCVIDGLDECDPDSVRFLVMKLKATTLFEGGPQSGATLKFIAVSRDTKELRGLSLFGFLDKPSLSQRVDLDSPSLRDIVKTNIDKFILQETEQLARENNYTPKLLEDVKTALMAGANGTFLWVDMICRELKEKSSTEVRETLWGFPPGLDAAYERMLEVVPFPRYNIVTTILRWITLAVRPLTLKELAIATNTPADDAHSLEEAMKIRVLYCGSFLEIDREGRVNFIHQSAKDYLLGQAAGRFRVEKAAASLELAQACHSYIRGGAFQDGAIIISRYGQQGGEGDELCRQSQKRLAGFPFLAYATLHWPDHFRDSDSMGAIRFSEWKTKSRQDWWETYCDMANDNFYSKKTPTLLHVASYFGLTMLAKWVLDNRWETLSEDEQTALPWAARAGHQAIVELLLKNGVDPNAKEEFGTALSWAAQNGNKPLVELLLNQERVDVNSRSDWGETPLLYAAGNGHEEVVRLLLAREELVVSPTDNWGWMPLLVAAQNGHEGMVRLLLSHKDMNAARERTADRALLLNATPERPADRALLLAAKYGREAVVRLLLDWEGVDANATDDEEKTPLSFAAENGHEAVVRLLLLDQNGVDVNARDRYDWTPLTMAARNANEGVTRLLLDQKGIQVDVSSRTGRTLLSLAAEHGLEAVVKQLLNREDVNPNSKDDSNWTPLSYAAENGREAVVKLLLDWRGVDLNARDGLGWTPLSMAVRSGHDNVALQLLNKKGVVANFGSSTDRTLLSFAAEKGLGAVVGLLLDRGDMSLNWQDKSGRTPLSFAAEGGHEVVARLLLARQGVEVNRGDHWDRTPLSYAAENGHKAIAVVGLLLGRHDVGANLMDKSGRTPLSFAAEGGHKAVVGLLLVRPDVHANLKDSKGRTPLSYAAGNGLEAVVKLLLDRQGVNANLKDRSGRTPLSFAAEGGHDIVAGLILGRQGGVNLQDNQGRTPLSYAAGKGHKAVVWLLLVLQGVEANWEDHRGWTPLSYAVENGHDTVVGLLLDRKGMDLSQTDSQSWTLVSSAATNGHEAVVRMLLGRARLSPTDETGHELVRLILARQGMGANLTDSRAQALLFSAAGNGHEGVVRLLLARQGVDVNLTDSQGRTPLSFAAKSGHDVVVGLLLAWQGVDANLADLRGRTPLSYAAENGRGAAVGLLLGRQSVDANLKDESDRTPLSFAADGGHEVVVGLLLGPELDVDVNLRDNGGRTPLLYAARNGRGAVVRLLLARQGVNANLTDKGWVPLSSAAGNRPDVVDVNMADSQGRTPLSYAAENGDDVVVRLFLASSQDLYVNLADLRGRTPLSYAAENGRGAAVGLLLGRQSVDANLKDESGRTPLSFAAEGGHGVAAGLLLDRPRRRLAYLRDTTLWSEEMERMFLEVFSVDANLKDNWRRTALSYAAENGHEVVVRLLLARQGVEVNLADSQGRTPLRYAEKEGHHAVVRLLATGRA